jgi:hypothetical protein
VMKIPKIGVRPQLPTDEDLLRDHAPSPTPGGEPG